MVVKAAALKAASKILTMAFWKGKSKVDLKVENRTDLKGLQMADAEAVAWTVSLSFAVKVLKTVCHAVALKEGWMVSMTASWTEQLRADVREHKSAENLVESTDVTMAES